MPLILLEGADGSGKTTLANELAARAGDSWILHQGPPPKGASIRDIYERPFFDGEASGQIVGSTNYYTPLDPMTIICDRWYLGELVYGPLLRGRSRLSPLQQRHLEGVLTSLGALQVIVDVSPEVRARRFADRGDELVSYEQAASAAARYLGLRPQLMTTYVNGDGLVVHTARGLLTTATREAREAAELWPLHRGGYVGPRRPELLLVGDRRNGGDLPAPFAPYSNAGCSTYLWETLASFPSVGVVNAHETDQLGALVHALRDPRVVALGRQAADALGREGVPHGTVPHPQWWKRFRYADQPEYAAAIRRAATTREDLIRA